MGASLAEILADAIQELIEAEVSARIGAEPHERTRTRTTQRNGHRAKAVSTPAGDLEIGIPSSAKARSSRSCSNRAGGSTRPCGQ